MEILQEKSSMVIDGDVEQRKFYIGDEQMILTHLRSGIYQNRIASPVREVISNAVDANVENGKLAGDVIIQRPTMLCGDYTVTDQGKGMSPEIIDKVLMGYGNSTKRQDNNQIGGFGVGAKSPLAYTDSFTTFTTWLQDGELWSAQYMIAVDGGVQDMITLTPPHRDHEATHTGTKVTIPVKKQDTTSFLQYSDVYEQCLMGRHSAMNSYTIQSIDEDCIKLRSYNNTNCFMYQEYGQCMVIVGGVPYKYDIDRIERAKGWKFPGAKYQLVIEVPIGAVTVNLSREGIVDNTKNRAVINGLFNDVFNKKAEEAKAVPDLDTELAVRLLSLGLSQELVNHISAYLSPAEERIDTYLTRRLLGVEYKEIKKKLRMKIAKVDVIGVEDCDSIDSPKELVDALNSNGNNVFCCTTIKDDTILYQHSEWIPYIANNLKLKAGVVIIAVEKAIMGDQAYSLAYNKNPDDLMKHLAPHGMYPKLVPAFKKMKSFEKREPSPVDNELVRVLKFENARVISETVAVKDLSNEYEYIYDNSSVFDSGSYSSSNSAINNTLIDLIGAENTDGIACIRLPENKTTSKRILKYLSLWGFDVSPYTRDDKIEFGSYFNDARAEVWSSSTQSSIDSYLGDLVKAGLTACQIRQPISTTKVFFSKPVNKVNLAKTMLIYMAEYNNDLGRLIGRERSTGRYVAVHEMVAISDGKDPVIIDKKIKTGSYSCPTMDGINIREEFHKLRSSKYDYTTANITFEEGAI